MSETSAKQQILCAVYTSDKAEETYLYVEQELGFERVPEDLKSRFPNPRLVTQFKLFPERKLARANPVNVIQSIRDNGYYLQLPPKKDAHLAPVADRNEKLPRH